MYLTRWSLLLAAMTVSTTGCAFFNTFFNARKTYNQARDQIRKHVKDTHKRSTAGRLDAHRFDSEPQDIPEAIRLQFDVVVDKTSKVVALHPDSRWVDDAILLMGKALYYRGDYLDARNRFEVFMSEYPGDAKFPEARFWYARTLVKLDLVADAMEHLQAVIEETSDGQLKARCAILSGDAMAEQKLYDRAEEWYTRALTFHAKESLNQEALFKRAYIAFLAANYGLAASSLRALSRTSLDADEAFDVGLMTSKALKELGQFDEALRNVNRLLSDFRYKAYFGAAELEAADILRRKGNADLAVAQFRAVIATYQNAEYNGNAYFFLGQMYDQGGPFEEKNKAEKYYQLVATRYPQSEHAEEARNRLQYLQTMAYLRGGISSDKALLAAIDEKLETGVLSSAAVHLLSTDTTETDLGLDEETLRDLAREDSLLKAGGILSATALEQDEITHLEDESGGETKIASVSDELSSVNVDNKPLMDKIAACQQELDQLKLMDSRDSLLQRREKIRLRIADDYFLLAEYFEQTLGLLDSALTYFEWVSNEYKGTSREERALYSIAGIYQKRESVVWKEILSDTYRRFPNGEYAFMAQKLLGLDTYKADPLTEMLEQSEKDIINRSIDNQTISRLENVAASDSARLKVRALYNLGVIQEKFRDDPDAAFAYYYALVVTHPESDLARSVRPKIDAYLKEKQLDAASAEQMVDSRFYAGASHSTIADTTNLTSDSLKTIAIDSTAQDTLAPKRVLRDEIPVKDRNIKRPGKRIPDKEGVREDDIDE